MNPQAYGKVVHLYKRDHTFVDRHRQSGVPDETSRRKRRRKLQRIQEAEHEKKELEEKEGKSTEESSDSGASSATSKGTETPSLVSSASSVDTPVANYSGIDKPFIRASSLDTLLEKTECERLPVTSKSTSNMDTVAGSVDTPLTGIPGISAVVQAGTGGWMSKVMRRLMFWRSTESIPETVETSAENTASKVEPSVETVGASQTVEPPVGNTSFEVKPSVEDVGTSETVEPSAGNDSSKVEASAYRYDTEDSARVDIQTDIQTVPDDNLLTKESNLRDKTSGSSPEKGSETIVAQVVDIDGSVLGSFVVHEDSASVASAGDKEPNALVDDDTVDNIGYNIREVPGETVVDDENTSSLSNLHLPSSALSRTNLSNRDTDRNTHVGVNIETILPSAFPKGHLVLPSKSNGQQSSSSVDSASNEQIRKGKHVDEDAHFTDEQMRATNVVTSEVTRGTKQDVDEDSRVISDSTVSTKPNNIKVTGSTLGDDSITRTKKISDSPGISEENFANSSIEGLFSPIDLTRDNANSQNNVSNENVFSQSADQYVFPISSVEENTSFSGASSGEMIVVPRNTIGKRETINDSHYEGSIPTINNSEECPNVVYTESRQIQIVETPLTHQFPRCNENKVLRCSLGDDVHIVRPSISEYDSNENEASSQDSTQMEKQVSKASRGSLLLFCKTRENSQQ